MTFLTLFFFCMQTYNDKWNVEIITNNYAAYIMSSTSLDSLFEHARGYI